MLFIPLSTLTVFQRQRWRRQRDS